MLGTNDTKPHNWSQKKEFKLSALTLLQGSFFSKAKRLGINDGNFP
jgi:hypothetical protein